MWVRKGVIEVRGQGRGAGRGQEGGHVEVFDWGKGGRGRGGAVTNNKIRRSFFCSLFLTAAVCVDHTRVGVQRCMGGAHRAALPDTHCSFIQRGGSFRAAA